MIRDTRATELVDPRLVRHLDERRDHRRHARLDQPVQRIRQGALFDPGETVDEHQQRIAPIVVVVAVRQVDLGGPRRVQDRARDAALFDTSHFRAGVRFDPGQQ